MSARASAPPRGSGAPFGAAERAIAARYLRAKRAHGGVALISILSFIGVLLAVAVLIIVMSVMNGFREELLSKILGVQGHMYVVTGGYSGEDVDKLRANVEAVPGVISAIPIVTGQTMAVSQGEVAGAIVQGVAPDDLAHLTFVTSSIEAGGLEGYGEGLNGGDKVIVGRRLADRFGLGVGDRITLFAPTGTVTPFGTTPRRKAYEIAGLFFVGHSEYDELFVYMPIDQARVFLGESHAADYVEVRVHNPDQIERLRQPIQTAAGPAAYIYDWKDRSSTLVGALNVERNVMRLILMMLVLIAALNIISGLVMLAKNKARDVAILRTMGATRNAVLRIFFLIGASIGTLGTGAGILAGVLFCIYIEPLQKFVEWVTRTPVFPAEIYYLNNIPAKLELHEVALVAAWGLLMSFVVTLLPAWNAARLDPVETLRNE